MSTNDRLDKWIKDSEDVLEAALEGDIDPEAFTDGRGGQALAALRAVINLHKPYPDEGMGWRDDNTYGYVGTVCGSCGTPDEYGVPWPCPTVRAVTAALGEES